MDRLNRDAIIAIVLLVFCGVFFWATFDIRQPDYGVLMPSTWPRVILGVLSFLSVIYLVQYLRQGADEIRLRIAKELGSRGVVHGRQCFSRAGL